MLYQSQQETAKSNAIILVYPRLEINPPCSALTLMLDPDQTFNKCCLRAVQFLYLARNRQIIERLRGNIEQLISHIPLNKDYQQDRENPKVMFQQDLVKEAS